ncbi:AMP-binding protein [Candidatus Enterococcus courvalinii]|uniref:AMP-binding protein n=1 Tax=Candidatus Enterococcus courvalinii TaxID=2815329 RepID=A0ABS3HYV3_9ENTE|nr:AMP-binding protein [Enterococcus sp. MSG2901]MBO0481107.1 AMP-binding protein [Enterococcus sp. MSG2901]
MIPFNKISHDQTALIYHEERISYGELLRVSTSYQEALENTDEKIIFIPMEETPKTIYKIVACMLAKKIFVPVPGQEALFHVQKIIDSFSSAALWMEEFEYFKTKRNELVLPEDTLFIGFTSGTTGERKGFVRNQQSWLRSFEIFHSVPVFHPKKYVTCLTPLHYSLGLYVLLQTLYSGQAFILDIKSIDDLLNMPEILNNVQIFSVPTVFRYWLARINKKILGAFDVILGGETMSVKQREQFFAQCPDASLYVFYGTSESSFITYTSDRFPENHCVGQNFPEVKISIKNKKNSIGKIVVNSPMNFQGYLKEGQFYPAEMEISTGDLGMYNRTLFYYGREDERINRKGEKIFPTEIEAIMLQLPQVKDLSIYGLPDPILGQRVVAEVVWQSQPLTLKEINQRIRKYSFRKVKIDTVITVNQVSYSESGKKEKISQES